MKILRMMIPAGLLGLSLLTILAAAQEKEDIARRIEGELMAPCCWAEPVSQHLSPMAEETRREIRAMLSAGKTEDSCLYELRGHHDRSAGCQCVHKPNP